jgi:thiol:disulfide interchange protein DsbD
MEPTRPLALLLAASFASLPSSLAAAQPSSAGQARHTRASLVSATDAVQPGRPLRLGIRLQMEPGWHTYWLNPGDAGLPTRVKWTLPEGFRAGEIEWPFPIPFRQGPVVSYGYEKEVLLAVPIEVPASLTATEVGIAARVDWLECQELCLPGRADLVLTLPVRTPARPALDAPAFTETRRRLPVKDQRWRLVAKLAEGTIVLGIMSAARLPIARARFFPLEPQLIDNAKPQQLEALASAHRLTLPRDPNGTVPRRLKGVLVVESPGRPPLPLDVDVAL